MRRTRTLTAAGVLAAITLTGCSTAGEHGTGAAPAAPTQAPAVQPAAPTAAPAADTTLPDTGAPSPTAAPARTGAPRPRTAPHPALETATTFIARALTDQQALDGATGADRVTSLAPLMDATGYRGLVRQETAHAGLVVGVDSHGACVGRDPYTRDLRIAPITQWDTARGGRVVRVHATSTITYLLTCHGERDTVTVPRTWYLELVPGTTAGHAWVVDYTRATTPAGLVARAGE